jgi:hypothetical protein
MNKAQASKASSLTEIKIHFNLNTSGGYIFYVITTLRTAQFRPHSTHYKWSFHALYDILIQSTRQRR